ncbi:MAG: heavy metal translocating P-type ATPase [Limisphaerales bacterium]
MWRGKTIGVAVLALLAIAFHLILRFAFASPWQDWPLVLALIAGGGPLVYELLKKAWHREFGSDLLAGISIVTAVILGEYLAGTIVVLMLSGGEVLENFAVRSASSVLRALANRMPSTSHRKRDGAIEEISIAAIRPDDLLIIYPHEICPVDGVVVEGTGKMDEAFLTGEPFEITKAPGSSVLSGAVNGESALTIRATRLPVDSRYAKIMEVMRESQTNRPKIRRLGDQLGTLYTPIAVTIALAAWGISGEAVRFLSVLVVATPCPLLIAIPVAVIGSISLSARRGIIIKTPVVLEQIDRCRTVIFDKTGTLTYGQPKLTEQVVESSFAAREVLQMAASVELYSKHPLAKAILAEAREQKIPLLNLQQIHEPPGRGVTARIAGRTIEITSRNKLLQEGRFREADLPPLSGGLECVIMIDGVYAATYCFHDAPRREGVSFIQHLGPKHQFNRIMIVSGDRESEVRYLAEQVGISGIHAQKSPEEKLEIVRAETAQASTLYVGDGINDAPAMMAATVGVAIGQNSDVAAEAAGAVVMDGELRRVDELMHISRRMRRIALQSAVGGMVLSIIGMGFAAAGYLPPVAGAITQEVIDVLAIANALRVALPPREITDF